MFFQNRYFIVIPAIIALSLVACTAVSYNNVNGQDTIPNPVPSFQDEKSSEDQNVESNTYSAKAIYDTNKIVADKDVTNLVVLIPEKDLIKHAFLPGESTIVEGTTVFWFNGEKGTAKGVQVEDKDGKIIFTNTSIPYSNATKFKFDDSGTYTFSVADNSSNSQAEKGSLTVIKSSKSTDNLSTNSTTPTLGLFVAHEGDKDYWNLHFNTLGFNIVDSYTFPISGNSAITSSEDSNDNQQNNEDGEKNILYVYTQKLDKDSSVISRIGTKIKILEEKNVD